MSANLPREQNLNQLMKIIEPSFNKMAEIHKAVDYRREASFAIQALNDNDYLMKTAMGNQDSFKRAVINVAAIGLSLNPVMKLAYLIPRKGKVCLDISYMGLIALAVDCGSIKWAQADVVREKDIFEYRGIGERPGHIFQPFASDRGAIIGAYCVAKTNQDEFLTVPMAIADIYKIRARSEAYNSQKGPSGPWVTDEVEMVKKTVIRLASKSWPKTSTERSVEKAIDISDESDPLLLETTVVDTAKRAEQIEIITSSLLNLNYDQDHYLNEILPKIIRRKVSCFEEMTDLEIDQILVQLDQLCSERLATSKGEKNEL